MKTNLLRLAGLCLPLFLSAQNNVTSEIIPSADPIPLVKAGNAPESLLPCDVYENIVCGSSFGEYNPADNTWQSRASFPGGKRYAAIGFAIDDHGYAGTGLQPKVESNGAFGFSEIYDDLWRYEPEKQ